MSRRLVVLCEGPTEANFVNQVLVPHFSGWILTTPLLETGRNPQGGTAKGGVTSYGKVHGDLSRLFHQLTDEQIILTTMLDFYKLPNDFPGYEKAIEHDKPITKVEHLERELVNSWRNHPRFIPYIQLHEYEALLFSDIGKLDWEFLEDKDQPQIEALKQVAEEFETPEDIDQGEHTAPSKRIIAHLPRYRKLKTTVGPRIAEKIGLSVLREKCPHFNAWITQIEAFSR